MSAIVVRSLVKRFGDFAAVDGVSLEIERGETFALLGPNGSGKTTTLKCIAGLAIPGSGEILIDGLDVRRSSRAAKRLISYLPQRVSFHDSLTAREVMEFYGRLRRVPSSRIDEIFGNSAFHFNGFADRPTGSFSGGMVQRLGLAVAILPDAPILLLDEPTMSLDPEGAIQFRAFLAALKQSGKTILFSSHVLSDVEQLADRVGIMAGGRLVAVRSVEELRNEIARGSRMRVAIAGNPADFLGIALKAGANDAIAAGGTLSVGSSLDARMTILNTLASAGATILQITTDEPSLEDIYLRFIHEKTADRNTTQPGQRD